MEDRRQVLAELKDGLAAFEEARPDPLGRYIEGWRPRYEYVTTEFSFDPRPWHEAADELFEINGVEAYLPTLTTENFLYYLPVYAVAILDLIADDEPPYLLEYLLQALVERTGDEAADLQALATPAQLGWLRHFLDFIAAGYELEDEPEDNEAIRALAREVAGRLSG